MAREPNEIVVASNGGVAVAPLGTALPTSATATLSAEYKDLGYINEDGVTITTEVESEGLPAWQSMQPVRIIVSGQEFTSSFSLMQWNEDTLNLAFGGGVYSTGPGPGEWTYLTPLPEEREEFAMVIDALDGTRRYRITLPRVQVSDLGDIQFTRTGAANLPVTITALPGTDGRSAAVYGSDSATAIHSTGATAGAPGSWTPAGSDPPDSVAKLIAGDPAIVVASPATVWTTGQYVQTGTAGASGEAHWNGTAWVTGRKT